MKPNLELLAPAGSPASLAAALDGGADAVYLGCSQFANARMNAENFDQLALSEALSLCRRRGVKAYITVNTLLSDRELEGLYQYASFLYQNGADGIIVQDLGVADFLHRAFPALPLHASTQMGICNPAGVDAARSIGCVRAVAARELNWEQLAELCRKGLEIEVFVHGALCACYSGFCLMSSMIGRRSGNRGECAQPCRLPYKIDGKKPQCLMSLKDLMLLPHLETLRKIGVASLKIEGRMKGPHYVGTVTSIYRRVLDGEPVTNEFIEQLTRAFDRGGYTDGYQTGKGAMFAYTRPSSPYGKQPEPKPAFHPIPLKMEGALCSSQPFALTMADDKGNRVRVTGSTPAFPAEKHPLTEETITQRLCKLGNTGYTAKSCRVQTEPGLMIPLGEIARLRRQACEQLDELRSRSPKRPAPPTEFSREPISGLSFSQPEWTVSVLTEEQYRALEQEDVTWLAVPIELAQKNAKIFDPTRTVLQLPAVCCEPEHSRICAALPQLKAMGFTRLLCGNIGDFYHFSDWEKKGDTTLWVYNSLAAQTLGKQQPTSLTLSPELNFAQLRAIRSPIPCEALVYGRLPLMFSRHCFVREARHSCRGDCALQDRTGAVFPTCCTNGQHVLYNSAPLYLGDKIEEFTGSCAAYLRAAFTTEMPDECVSVLQLLQTHRPYSGDFTRGHYFRGVGSGRRKPEHEH